MGMVVPQRRCPQLESDHSTSRDINQNGRKKMSLSANLPGRRLRKVSIASQGKKTPVALRRLRMLLLFAATLAYLALIYIGPEFILASQANDANTVSELSTENNEFDAGDGYAAMAFLYRFSNPSIRIIILFFISVVFFFYVTKHIAGPVSASISLFLMTSPILLFLCFFVKDSLYIPFVIGICWISSRARSDVAFFLSSAVILILFSLIFRQYFFIVCAFMLGIYAFRQSHSFWRIMMILIIPIALLIIPPNIYTLLQEQRDIVNAGRVGFSGSGTRTAFMNYTQPDGFSSFFVNYCYAIARLNFPVLFNFGLKEIYHMVIILLMGWLTILGLWSRDPRIWRTAVIFTAHFLTLMLFEPDLGSYLRHITTSLPFVAPALGLISITRPKDGRTPRRRARRPSLWRSPPPPGRSKSGHHGAAAAR
jgi:hypothetical protein